MDKNKLKQEIIKKLKQEMSMTGTGASVTPGVGAGVATKYAFGKTNKSKPTGWKDAPSIPNRPSKAFDYKELWEEDNQSSGGKLTIEKEKDGKYFYTATWKEVDIHKHFVDEIKLKPSSPSFTSQISKLLKFDIYPNPALNELRVNISSVEDTFHYQIFDLQGIEKKSGQIENKVNISIHDITNGNYIISITSKNGNLGSKPFIILH